LSSNGITGVKLCISQGFTNMSEGVVLRNDTPTVWRTCYGPVLKQTAE
jgi:hypothetical protein